MNVNLYAKVVIELVGRLFLCASAGQQRQRELGETTTRHAHPMSYFAGLVDAWLGKVQVGALNVASVEPQVAHLQKGTAQHHQGYHFTHKQWRLQQLWQHVGEAYFFLLAA